MTTNAASDKLITHCRVDEGSQHVAFGGGQQVGGRQPDLGHILLGGHHALLHLSQRGHCVEGAAVHLQPGAGSVSPLAGRQALVSGNQALQRAAGAALCMGMC